MGEWVDFYLDLELSRLFDPYDGWYNDPAPKSCNRCGKHGLEWREITERVQTGTAYDEDYKLVPVMGYRHVRWALFEDNREHACVEVKPEDFPIL